jgi:hypothetical protein
MLRWTRVVDFFTAMLVVVGGIQAWAFIQSERATLAIIKFRVDAYPPTPEDPFTVILTIKNGGKSAATITGEANSVVLVAATSPCQVILTTFKRRTPLASPFSREIASRLRSGSAL